jgi:hypothetical protein
MNDATINVSVGGDSTATQTLSLTIATPESQGGA